MHTTHQNLNDTKTISFTTPLIFALVITLILIVIINVCDSKPSHLNKIEHSTKFTH